MTRRVDANSSLSRPGVEKLENPAGAFGADAGHLAEVGDGSPLDLLQGSEMMQQRALARRPDAGDFLQARLADILLAQLAVRADHKAMRLVAQPLDEIQHRIARLQFDRLAGLHEQRLSAGRGARFLRYRPQRG